HCRDTSLSVHKVVGTGCQSCIDLVISKAVALDQDVTGTIDEEFQDVLLYFCCQFKFWFVVLQSASCCGNGLRKRERQLDFKYYLNYSKSRAPQCEGIAGACGHDASGETADQSVELVSKRENHTRKVSWYGIVQ